MIAVSLVCWIAVPMAYATTAKRRCVADVPLEKMEINAKTVGRFKISFAFVILMNWAKFAFLTCFFFVASGDETSDDGMI